MHGMLFVVLSIEIPTHRNQPKAVSTTINSQAAFEYKNEFMEGIESTDRPVFKRKCSAQPPQSFRGLIFCSILVTKANAHQISIIAP